MDTLYALISFAVFGLIVGAIARLLKPGEQNMGCLMTIALGVVGSFVGGFISSLFTGRIALDEPAGWIMSIVGAVILLVIAGFLTKKGPPAV